MFSGIVETTSRVVSCQPRSGYLHMSVAKPSHFNDLSIGESIAVDGICLTVEAWDEREIRFALGPETLRITGWTAEGVLGRDVNLERSLRLNDRIHGHLVTGHVDARTRVLQREETGETLALEIEIPDALRAFIWPKGSVALNGVSLTVNGVSATSFRVGLIPETLRRTNLKNLRVNDGIHLEIDNMARGLVHWAGWQKELER